MALSFAYTNLNPAGGSGTPKSELDALWATQTTVTIDSSYASGGIPLTPAQLNLTDMVLAGQVNVRTPTGAGTIVDGVLDCTTPTAPKLKLNTATGEVANGSNSGAVIDILAFGV